MTSVTNEDHSQWVEMRIHRIRSSNAFSTVPVWEWSGTTDRARELLGVNLAAGAHPSQPRFALQMAVDELMARQRYRELCAGAHSSYLDGPHWDRVKLAIRILADYRCDGCGTPVSDRDTHHRTYRRTGSERLFDVDLLCTACHRAEHPGWREEELRVQPDEDDIPF